MNKILIPYGHGEIEFDPGERKVKAVLRQNTLEAPEDEKKQAEIVKTALESPVSSPRLCELAQKASRLLIITSDHTRPVPSKITLPVILNEARSKNPEIQIKILVATGMHRPTSPSEMEAKFGKDLVESEEFIIHDCCASGMVKKGTLPSGAELRLNPLVDWADLLISEGFIEPHFFAGFSGGRKSVLPGIASEVTVRGNHCASFIASERARTGNLDKNPIHEDMLFAAEAAGLAFIMNVVIDSKKNILKAFAGHPGKAHEEGCAFVSGMAEVKAVEADIVITSNAGYPLDQNIYQAVKGMSAAEVCVRKGGVIIMLAECEDGHGGESFYRYFADAPSVGKLAEDIGKVSQDDTGVDQWEAQILARVLLKAKVIFVSSAGKKLVEDFKMIYAKNLAEAYETALSICGGDAETVVIPDGVGVIVRG